MYQKHNWIALSDGKAQFAVARCRGTLLGLPQPFVSNLDEHRCKDS
jgi:hypothetical protein